MTNPRTSLVRRRAFRWPSTAAVAVVATLTLSSCGSATETAGTTTATTAASAGSSTNSSGSGSVTSSATGVLSSTETTAGSGDVVALAEAFAATLTDEQKASLNQEYTFANAANWSNLPNGLLTGAGFGGGGTGGPPAGMTGAPGGATGGMPGTGTQTSTGRVGLQTDSLSDEQWAALEALLAAATGSAENEGFDEIVQHLEADDYLADNGGGETYGRGNYYIAFLGSPSDTGTWELQFGGHHLALANTYANGALAGATPSFRGIEPFSTVEVDGDTVQPEQQEQEAFAALLTSFDATQAAAAKLSTSYTDILLGPGKDWAFPTTSEGIIGSQLTDAQKALLLAAINTYVDDIDDADAATILTKYQSELDQTYVSYSGTTDMTSQGDYIRIDGPSVWIEFSMQNGIVLSGAHPHAVWRDKQTDYAGLTS